MAIGVGSRVGPYEVTALLGQGGMGKVWRAHHTGLKRDDALKVLPDAFASDPDRLARFQREAQVLASLNHPNIAHVYGLEQANGVQALVMELVEGPTLADRIAQGPIPVDEALPIAKQIAEALEAAHEQGIIHRDLKPANIKVRPDGTVKVLDFGLAKALEPANAVSPNTSQSPTITSPALMTGVSMLLGTAAYMSPEQARGKPADRRSDVWAFGAVLYEMLTGHRAFDGEEVSDTLASVLAREPNWNALPQTLSPIFVALLNRTLYKEPRQRIHDIADIRLALEGAFGAVEVSRGSSGIRPSWSRALLISVAAIAIAVLAVIAVQLTNEQPPAQVVRLTVEVPPGTSIGAGNADTDFAISPDGARIAFVTGPTGPGSGETVENAQRLWVRSLAGLEAQSISGTRSARAPFFSPDGNWIGFFDSTPDVLRKVSVNGGAAITLCDVVGASGATGGGVRGASWGLDNTILFATNEPTTGLLRVSANGGTPEVLTRPNPAEGDVDHFFPEILPGGRAVLFTIMAASGAPDVTARALEASKIAVLDLETREHKVLIPGGTYARFVPSGHIVYGRAGALWAVGFDVTRLEIVGTAVPVQQEVVTKGTGAASFAVAQNGSLAYLSGTVQEQVFRRSLVWLDRRGREEPLGLPPRAYNYPRISPDGRKVLVDIRDEDLDIWAWDMARPTLTRMTFAQALEWNPVWTPDGSGLVYSSTPPEPPSIFWQAADGTGMPERLTSGSYGQFPIAFSPDGARLIIREEHPGTGSDLFMLAVNANRRVEPLIQTPFNERNGVISPNGRWLAYQSDESGGFQVYVRPFPNVNSGRWQVSTDGGRQPTWARGGAELLYLDNSNSLVAAEVMDTTAFATSAPVKLFDGQPQFVVATLGRSYDVSADGQRFLFLKRVDDQGENIVPSAKLILVQNWFEELKRLVPTN